MNGGLNCSVLDGWWAETYTPEVGWAIGDGHEHPEAAWDTVEATQLYELLEEQIVPAFYDRDARGIPTRWVQRIRASMAHLTPHYSSNRMLAEYVEQFYLPAAAAWRRRADRGGALAQALHVWQRTLAAHWHDVHFGSLDVQQEGEAWSWRVQVYLGRVLPEDVRVEVYADPVAGEAPLRQEMTRGDPIPGALHGYVYQATVPAERPSWHWTPRILPYHPEVRVPLEAAWIVWQR